MSLCSTSSWSSAKPGIAPRNNRHLATLLYNSSPAKFQAQYDTAAPGRPRVRPCQGLRERVDLLYNNYAARCLDFLLPILEFLRLIIQHHGVWNHGRISSLILTTSVRIIAHDSRRKSCHNFVYHRKSSLVIIHKYTASQYTSSAAGFCPSRNDVYCPVFVRPVLPEFRGAFPGLRFLSQSLSTWLEWRKSSARTEKSGKNYPGPV